nr:MAG TPA: hypothetical protein [Caudoviricetes sp.]
MTIIITSNIKHSNSRNKKIIRYIYIKIHLWYLLWIIQRVVVYFLYTTSDFDIMTDFLFYHT